VRRAAEVEAAMVAYEFSGRTAIVTSATLVLDGGYWVSV
jgi:hypothetical protein